MRKFPIRARRAWYSTKGKIDFVDLQFPGVGLKCWEQSQLSWGKLNVFRSVCVAFVMLDQNGERD